MKKKIGIFYINAGGGHSATARALAKEITEKYSDQVEPILVDAMQGGPFLTRWFLERGYALAVNNFPYNWRVIYWLSKISYVMRGEDKLFTSTAHSNIEKTITEEKFDVIITVHYFLTSPVLKILAEKNLSTPVYSIVTDPFTVPPHWFLNKGIKYFVFSDVAKKLALENEITPGNVSVVSPVINDKFFVAKNFDKNKIRENLGFPLDKKIILVVAGGDGLYAGGKVLRSLVRLPSDYQVVVVCGREQKFFEKATVLKRKFSNKILAVFGFVDNMEELLVAADLVVGKAGPATIFESLVVGRPVILTYYIWEQEKGNCDFVVQNGFGKYQPKLDELADTVKKFFEDEQEYQRVLDNIKAYSIDIGATQIAKEIIENKIPTN